MIKKTLDKYLKIFSNYLNLIMINKLYLFIALIIIIIFLTILYFLYKKFIKPKLNSKHVLNKEFINTKVNDNDVIIIFFYTEWCPYCRTAKPEWDNFKSYIDNINNTNNYKVKLLSIDCDKKPDIAEKYNIEGYPSIKLIYKGKTYDYDAKPNKKDLIKFLETTVE